MNYWLELAERNAGAYYIQKFSKQYFERRSSPESCYVSDSNEAGVNITTSCDMIITILDDFWDDYYFVDDWILFCTACYFVLYDTGRNLYNCPSSWKTRIFSLLPFPSMIVAGYSICKVVFTKKFPSDRLFLFSPKGFFYEIFFSSYRF